MITANYLKQVFIKSNSLVRSKHSNWSRSGQFLLLKSALKVDKCKYLNYILRRKTISKSYAFTACGMPDKHILPYFGKKQLREITAYDIEKWLETFTES